MPKGGFLFRLFPNSLGERTCFFEFDESNHCNKSFYPLPLGERVRGVGAQFIEPVLSCRDMPSGAEGTVCTFTGNFRRAKILKRFSCETGITLETITVKQAE